MKHKIILSRTYLTEIVIEADDSEQARAKFNELGGAIYEQELEQCNVISETVLVESEDDGFRTCSVTGEKMTEGWVANDGAEYFKYENDAKAWCVANGYVDIETAYEDDVIYWTEWEIPNFLKNL